MVEKAFDKIQYPLRLKKKPLESGYIGGLSKHNKGHI